MGDHLQPDRDSRRLYRSAVVLDQTEVRRGLGLDFGVLALEDNAYRLIRWKQAVDGLEDIDDFPVSPESAFTKGRVQHIVAPIDYTETVRVIIEELEDR